MLTGLLTATPPSMRLNTRETGGVEFGSVSMKSTGGRYVGAAAVAWHTYFIGALSKSSLLACIPRTCQALSPTTLPALSAIAYSRTTRTMKPTYKADIVVRVFFSSSEQVSHLQFPDLEEKKKEEEKIEHIEHIPSMMRRR